ncbi:hypothetical protein ACIA8F_08545 [Streptomyces sp. NPDC051563]|uniref:hypothetical protein n=1 Tax=Streptomyces sp. NPDC051563 TaxID=3365659 RepID=UPI0037967BE9
MRNRSSVIRSVHRRVGLGVAAAFQHSSLFLPETVLENVLLAGVRRAGSRNAAIAQGMSVVLVEQNLSLARSTARSVAVMQKGVIVHSSTGTEFTSRPEDLGRLLGVG